MESHFISEEIDIMCTSGGNTNVDRKTFSYKRTLKVYIYCLKRKEAFDSELGRIVLWYCGTEIFAKITFLLLPL